MNKIVGDNDDLNAIMFDAKNFFYIGNFMNCINTVLPEQNSGAPELIAYIYYSYIAIDSIRLIPSEIKENNKTALIAFRHLYDYYKNPEKREDIIQLFTDKLHQDVGETNIWQMVASIVFCNEGLYENVLKIIHDSDDLECMAITIYCLIKMNRIELARQIVNKMQEKSDDATITQLAQAWVNIGTGGEQLQDAFHIFQEFCEKYSSTPLLLNGQAVCHIGQERYEDAEIVLKESLTKKHNDYDTLVNLIVLSHLTGKSPDIINRYIEQLRQFYPNGPFVTDLCKKEEEFDRLCIEYAPSVKNLS